MPYVDGWILPVPEANKEAYREMAVKMGAIFKEFGALQVVDCWGNDVPHGKTTDFFMATKAEEGENIVFSWIVWDSKEARDAGWAKAMADERMKPDPDNPAPFDGKRMFWGGFEVIQDTAA